MKNKTTKFALKLGRIFTGTAMILRASNIAAEIVFGHCTVVIMCRHRIPNITIIYTICYHFGIFFYTLVYYTRSWCYILYVYMEKKCL